MNEQQSPDHSTVLKPVIARLKDIERKCDSMGSRNEDFPLMKQRLTSIIERLQAGKEPSGEPPAFASMARELFPVAHLFESLGFISVGKEISHIERTLRELAPSDESATAAEPEPVGPSRISSARQAQPSETEIDRAIEEMDSDPKPSRPWPVFIGFFVLLAAVAVAAMIILQAGPFAPQQAAAPAAVTPAPVATSAPTEVPIDTLIPTPRPPQSGRPVLSESVAEARLAIERGDLEGAVRHLSAAALIDRDDTSVLQVAERLVTIFVNDANRAASEQRWEDAEKNLERARRTALRFGHPTAEIDRAARSHAAIVRYQMLGPRDTAAIRAAQGKRIEVALTDGTMRPGRVGGIQGDVFLLEVEDVVGGGALTYIDELPLATIRAIKVFED